MSELTFTWQKIKFILAWVTYYAGDTEKALQIHKDVLSARIQIIGEGHRRTRDSMYMIGEVYRLQGNYEKAEKYFRRTLTNIEEDQFPEESIARANLHLALTISANSEQFTPERQDEASRLRRTVETFRAKYSHEIPERIRANDEIRVHDYIVSIWDGRPTGLLGSLATRGGDDEGDYQDGGNRWHDI